MNIDKRQLIKSLSIILVVFAFVVVMTRISHKKSLTLSDYAQQHPDLQLSLDNPSDDLTTDELSEKEVIHASNEGQVEKKLQDEKIDLESTLVGAKLNGITEEKNRVTYEDSFYYEPLSDDLKRYITGVSFPQNSDANVEELSKNQISDFDSTDQSQDESTRISYDDLMYVHIKHYDFDRNPAEGELICNKDIAQDLVEIFYALYQNEYLIEKVHLIDEYEGDDTASMEDNNTSCFNYRNVDGTTTLSKHALGLAIDVNPFYNPYITYNTDGTQNVSPEDATGYADRDLNFPYKIDENDLCYKLFISHGFTWGGNWNTCKDYQHFQKAN